MAATSLFPRLAAILALLAVAACGSGGSSPRTAADLANPLLSPEYSVWMIGPVALLATPDEIGQYLTLSDDPSAVAFIEQFWARRATGAVGENRTRRDFDARAAEADRRYSEGGVAGRRTARGTIFTVYGVPTSTDYDAISHPELGPIELWHYDGTAPAGLDGRRPLALYRFVKSGDLTVLLRGSGSTRPLRQSQP